MKFRFQRSWARDSWEILIYEYNKDHTAQMYTIEIKKGSVISEGGEFPQDERLYLREEQFKQITKALIESFADAGLLKGSSAVESELKAANKHLEDMRTLVFKK